MAIASCLGLRVRGVGFRVKVLGSRSSGLRA